MQGRENHPGILKRLNHRALILHRMTNHLYFGWDQTWPSSSPHACTELTLPNDAEWVLRRLLTVLLNKTPVSSSLAGRRCLYIHLPGAIDAMPDCQTSCDSVAWWCKTASNRRAKSTRADGMLWTIIAVLKSN